MSEGVTGGVGQLFVDAGLSERDSDVDWSSENFKPAIPEIIYLLLMAITIIDIYILVWFWIFNIKLNVDIATALNLKENRGIGWQTFGMFVPIRKSSAMFLKTMCYTYIKSLLQFLVTHSKKLIMYK